MGLIGDRRAILRPVRRMPDVVVVYERVPAEPIRQI